MYIEIGKKDTFVSPGSIGGKIKRIREHLGLSQKQLGLRCGFSETTADVRIRQYESNKKVPREKALNKLCNALEIDESSLFDADLLTISFAYHALFDIEDFHGLHPVQIDGRYYLEFSGPTLIDKHEVNSRSFHSFLKSWAEKRAQYLPTEDDNEETKKEKRKKYDLWRYEYPMNEARETSEQIRMLQKKRRLEKELQELNEKLGAVQE